MKTSRGLLRTPQRTDQSRQPRKPPKARSPAEAKAGRRPQAQRRK